MDPKAQVFIKRIAEGISVQQSGNVKQLLENAVATLPKSKLKSVLQTDVAFYSGELKKLVAARGACVELCTENGYKKAMDENKLDFVKVLAPCCIDTDESLSAVDRISALIACAVRDGVGSMKFDKCEKYYEQLCVCMQAHVERGDCAGNSSVVRKCLQFLQLIDFQHDVCMDVEIGSGFYVMPKSSVHGNDDLLPKVFAYLLYLSCQLDHEVLQNDVSSGRGDTELNSVVSNIILKYNQSEDIEFLMKVVYEFGQFEAMEQNVVQRLHKAIALDLQYRKPQDISPSLFLQYVLYVRCCSKLEENLCDVQGSVPMQVREALKVASAGNSIIDMKLPSETKTLIHSLNLVPDTMLINLQLDESCSEEILNGASQVEEDSLFFIDTEGATSNEELAMSVETANGSDETAKINMSNLSETNDESNPPTRKPPKGHPTLREQVKPNSSQVELTSKWLAEAAKVMQDDRQDNNQKAQMKNLKTKLKRRKHARALPVYELENQRLKGLRKHQKKILAKPKAMHKYRAIDELFELERLQMESASKLQRTYRAYRKKLIWRRYFIQVSSAIKIQARFRGMMARKLVFAWHKIRKNIATKIQAFVRGCLFRYIHRTAILWERKKIIQIQSAARRFLSRRRVRQLKRTVAAVHIQAIWRGFLERRSTDEVCATIQVLKVQSAFRMYRCKKKTKQMKEDNTQAVLLIQKLFRGVLDREATRAALRLRETQNTNELLQTLQVEAEWNLNEAKLIRNRITRMELYEKANILEDRLVVKRGEVDLMEEMYFELIRQRERASPRSIEEGWFVNSNENILKQRREITNAKFSAIFGAGLELRKTEEMLDRQERRISMHERRNKDLIRWRTEELVDKWSCDAHEDRRIAKQQRRFNVADQRRRWHLKYFTDSGKVDMQRRYGFKWDPNVYKEPNFEGPNGYTDILAFCNGERETQFGNKFNSLLQRMKLVNAQSNTEQASSMLNPMFQIVQDRVDQVVQNGGHIDSPQEYANTKANSQMKKQLANRVKTIEKKVEQLKLDAMIEDSPVVQPVKTKPVSKKTALPSRVPWELLDQLQAQKDSLTKL